MKRVLIAGIDSTLGAALAESLRCRGVTVLGTTRRAGPADREVLHLDFSESTETLPELPKVDACVLCAGVTSLAACEQDPAKSRRINVDAALEVARRVAQPGGHVVFPSTNLVFDGAIPHRTADDAPTPQTEYGRQKADAEQGLLALAPAAAVVRFTKVIGPATPLFADWVAALRRGEAVHAFDDMVMAPVALEFAAECLTQIAEARAGGIFQVSAPADISYLDAARYIADRLGADPSLVVATSFADAGVSAAMAPQHTTLDATRIAGEFGLQAADAFAVLDAALALEAHG